jgi:hypothetical protein
MLALLQHHQASALISLLRQHVLHSQLQRIACHFNGKQTSDISTIDGVQGQTHRLYVKLNAAITALHRYRKRRL